VKFSRRDFLRLAGLGGAAWASGRQAWGQATGIGPDPWPAHTEALQLLAAGRFLPSASLAGFTAATGVALAITQSGDPSDLAGYDLALVPSHSLPQLIRLGWVRELGPAAGFVVAGQRPYDPYNVFSRLAGRGAIGINARGVRAPATWADFFELAQTLPAHLPLAETFNAALLSLGASINTRSVSSRGRALHLLSGLPSWPLAEARLAVGPPLPGWEFRAPAEGAELWEDCFCVPAGSARPAHALALIRFVLQQQSSPPVPPGRLEPRSAFGPI
jgi:hypothetical protein